jgi:hypothetical protein
MPSNFLSCARLAPLLWAVLVPVHALADTSATLATAINIPKGPASIEGFGRAYEVNPASGLPSLEYPLEVPPGRAGHAPRSWRSTTTRGAAPVHVLGLGWSLDLPAIERSPRAGIPRPGEPEVWTLRHLGDGEELTEIQPGVYRQRIEQGAPIIVHALPGGAMSAVAADGTGYLFGLTDDARDRRRRRSGSPGAVGGHRRPRQPHRLSIHTHRRQRRAAAVRHLLERRPRERHVRTRAAPGYHREPRPGPAPRARPPHRRDPHRGRR